MPYILSKALFTISIIAWVLAEYLGRDESYVFALFAIIFHLYAIEDKVDKL